MPVEQDPASNGEPHTEVVDLDERAPVACVRHAACPPARIRCHSPAATGLKHAALWSCPCDVSCRELLCADLQAESAAGSEGTGSRPVQHVPGLAGNRLQRELPSDVEAWDALEEAERVGVAWLRENLICSTGLDERSGVHDVYALTHAGDDSEVVRDQDERGPPFCDERAQEVEDLRLNRHVERRCRLVRDEELRLARERHCDHYSLAHSAGELMWIVPDSRFRARDPHLVEKLDDPDVRFAGRHVEVGRERLANLPADGVYGVQARHGILKDHPDLLASHAAELSVRHLQEVASCEQRGASSHPSGSREDAQERERRDALPAAGLADDSERLSLPDRERDVIDCIDRPALGRELDAQSVDREERVRHGRAASGRELPGDHHPGG